MANDWTVQQFGVFSAMGVLQQDPVRLNFAIILLAVTITACSTTTPRDSDSVTVPRWEWAAFDGDETLGRGTRDFYARHQVFALNGRNLHDRQSARVKDAKINCLLRDCKLHPGQHVIDIGYFWTSSEAYRKQARKDAWKGIGYALSIPVQIMFGNTPGAPPGAGPRFRCRFTLAFEVEAKGRYVLNIVHDDLHKSPEEFQIVDISTGAVVASVSPC